METHILYQKSLILNFDPDRHTYTVNGEIVDSVTSILGQTIAKPALIPWATKTMAENLMGLWKAGVSYDEIQIKEMLNTAKQIYKYKSEKAADIGTLVHEWISKYIQGLKPPMPINKEMQGGVKAFLKWTKENKIQFKLTERKVFSKKYKFAGTCDFTAIINGKNFVGDIKTSNAIYNESFYQVAAYTYALQEEFPKMKPDGNIIVRCGKDGSLEVKSVKNGEVKENFKAFLGALAIYRRAKALKQLYFNQKNK